MKLLALLFLCIVGSMFLIGVLAWSLYNRDQKKSRRQTLDWDSVNRKLSHEGRLDIDTPYNQELRKFRRYNGARSTVGDEFVADDEEYLRKIRQKRGDDKI